VGAPVSLEGKVVKKKDRTKGESGLGPGITMLVMSVVVFCSFVIIKDKNILGPLGELIARVLYFFIGKAAYVLPFIMAFIAVAMLQKDYRYSETRFVVGFTLLVVVLSMILGLIFKGTVNEKFKLVKVAFFYSGDLKNMWDGLPVYMQIMDNFKFYTAGYAGGKAAIYFTSWFSVVGAYIMDMVLLIISLMLLRLERVLVAAGAFAAGGAVKFFEVIIKGGGSVLDALRESIMNMGGGPKEKKEKKEQKPKKDKDRDEDEEKDEDEDEEKETEEKPKKKEKLTITKHEEKPRKSSVTQALVMKGDYTLPPTSLLKSEKQSGDEPYDYAYDAERLKKTLSDFGIEADIVNVVDGPVISRFDLELATGVKVSRVENLSADIALAMKVEMVRVAAVPGKSLLGIEVPKSQKKTIYLKELIEDEQFSESQSLLTLAIGRDLSGKPVIANLEDMPHLLIAGSTGSGKSVCINSIITSILYKASPDEVKMLLVDPKKVELTQYNELPHLIAPVITDARHAAYVLKRLVAEMKSRYDLLSEEGAQNIEIYNKKVHEYNEDIKKDADVKPEEYKKSLPYIVLIIDELADLMTMQKGNVEESLQRLAQLSRAVGIHIILATQRPSVDVITGVIKANFPSRIAFKVKSQVDSRTILDTKGAEALLGKGDMLYAPANIVKPIRGQAAFVRDEIPRIVTFIRKQRKQVISPEFDLKDEDMPSSSSFGDDDGVDPDVYKQACELAREKGKISTSFLQRKLGIGYSRAARMIDMMEEKGLITPADGNKPREWKGD
jgi:S-DNA-T family DNA segregation ATPase FtsK/SpoIIIE